MSRVQMNPNFEPDMQRQIVANANEAVDAVGAANGRTAEQIHNELAGELERRGINMPADSLNAATDAIVNGQAFEFRW